MDGDANALFRNDGAHGLWMLRRRPGLAWGGRAPNDKTNGTVRPCAADVNGDGRLDLFTANYGPMGLFLNDGKGTFRDVSKAWGIAIDGRDRLLRLCRHGQRRVLDLYVNGTVTGGTSYRDYLFRGTGARFEDVTPDSIKAQDGDHGVQWADIDRDGNVDLLLNGSAPTGMQMYWKNAGGSAATRSLQVNVVRTGGAAGAEVRVYRAGTRTLLATRVIDSGSGYDAQNVADIHLGVPIRDATVDVEVDSAPARRAHFRGAERSSNANKRRPLQCGCGPESCGNPARSADDQFAALRSRLRLQDDAHGTSSKHPEYPSTSPGAPRTPMHGGSRERHFSGMTPVLP